MVVKYIAKDEPRLGDDSIDTGMISDYGGPHQ